MINNLLYKLEINVLSHKSPTLVVFETSWWNSFHHCKMYITKLEIGVKISIIYGKLQYNQTDSVDVEVRSKEFLKLALFIIIFGTK